MTSIVEVGALNCGTLGLPRKWIFAGEEASEVADEYPDYAFYIRHPTSGRQILFDLGLNKDLDAYPPIIQGVRKIMPLSVPKDAADNLLAGGVSPSEIDTIALSHVHFDHIGDPNKFPNATVLTGHGSKATAYPGWPTRSSPFSDYVFEPTSGKYEELDSDSESWTAWGPFEKAYDLFGDGSFLLLDTPGHMVGHLGGLARTGEDEYVFMGGDVCHARHFFSPCCGLGWEISTKMGPAGPGSGMHQFADKAQKSISKVEKINKMESVLVAIAHDAALEGIIPKFPELLNGWRAKGLKAAVEQRGRLLQPRK